MEANATWDKFRKRAEAQIEDRDKKPSGSDGPADRVPRIVGEKSKPKWEKPSFDQVNDLGRIIGMLATLDAIEYEQYRKKIADKFNLRPSILDAAVKEARAILDDDTKCSGLLVEPPKPWDDPVEGAELLDSMRATFNRYLVLPDHADTVLSLWALLTYVYNIFRTCAKLLVTSPEKRCGKTTLLEVLEALARCAMSTSNITAPALFRTIDEAKPTIIIDEADTFLRDNDDLRGIVNSGHTRKGAFVIRCVGDDNKPTRFSTWCPTAISMIRLPADTIVDRSVVIQLRRKLPGERVERMMFDLYEKSESIRRRAERWAQDHSEALKGSDPPMPHCSNDRAIDNWTPLFAIAEAAGGDWPERAKQAFVALAGLEDDDDDDGIGPMLLRDIKAIFDERRIERIFSSDLVEALIDLEESQWSEWRHGRPITQNSLSRILTAFGIRSKGTIRIGAETKKGYLESQFEDAFKRYIYLRGCISTVTTAQPTAGAASSGFQNVTPSLCVTVEKALQPTAGTACDVVTVQKEGSGEKKSFPGKNDNFEVF